MDSLEIRKGLIELEPLEAFKNNPCESNLARISKTLHTPEMLEAIFDNPKPDEYGCRLLRFVSKRLVTRSVCEKALLRDIRNIYSIPEEFMDKELSNFIIDHHLSLSYVPIFTKELCEKAVEYDWSNLKYVPKRYKLKKICINALNQNLAAIAFIPERFITPDLAKKAIDSITNDLKKGIIHYPISSIPSKLLTDEITHLYLTLDPKSIKSLPPECITEERLITALQQNGLLLNDIPDEYRSSDKIIQAAIKQTPYALRYVPDNKITRALCDKVFESIKNDTDINFWIFPEEYREKYIKAHENTQPLFHSHPIKLMSSKEEETTKDTDMLKTQTIPSLTVYNVALTDTEIRQRIYYVSDLHLEHQLDLNGKPLNAIIHMIEEKVDELISKVPDKESTLLIAGDVAAGGQLMIILCKELQKKWEGKIIFVLGNHELWDLYCDSARPVDTIISQFKEVCQSNRLHILENDLLIHYKGQKWATLAENEILEASPDDLRSICTKSLFLVLGGIGFSGCNPKYNADVGLYRNKLSREEEISRSKRFRRIHDKLMSCMSDTRILVLTHTAPEDWTNGKLCSRWIYVNGHSHHNRFQFNDNEPCILANNQIGYKPRTWSLKSFEYERTMRYDPLAYLPDGIHEITPHAYKDFNLCLGISMYDFKRQGHIFAIKRNGIYMFVYENRKTSILAGGGLRTGHHDKQYYYDYMPLYVAQIKKLFTPYYNALSQISEGIKKIGGTGRIHGNIVDIDFYNHIYLDPYDGKIKPYFAYDMDYKAFFSDIHQLIENSPCIDEKELYLQKLKEHHEELKKLLPVDNKPLAKVPEIVFDLDRDMYEPSRQMRAVQYVLEQNVIRFWRDKILTYSIPDNDKLGYTPKICE